MLKWLRKLLCWIGLHDYTDFSMPCPIHCIHCLKTPSGKDVSDVLDEIEERNEAYS